MTGAESVPSVVLLTIVACTVYLSEGTAAAGLVITHVLEEFPVITNRLGGEDVVDSPRPDLCTKEGSPMHP